ncbi:hypothetical protein AZI85_08830 [Bdellovibrio bacteriovorus]|uniref:Uncharacterized protein n=1 Tax=Bdellovibrio bacteriovorus TaxID=959 RepID=A0A150WDA7_BDEBC|nr:hypothetical protein [Bdellovibrio bacteriovorus]KYG61054.1 hypothetical protein AZI85_08830 [Bdellovibrio bacteriovorus]
MKFIYVLEDDERIQKDLFDTLKSIDPQLHIRFFLNLSEFHEWLKTALTAGPLALAPGGRKHKDDTSEDVSPAATHELRLVIAKNEFLGIQNMGLIKRARDFFMRKKMCSEQEPTALILTAFDSPDFNIALAEERIINNVIFKPFDKLILKQHLEYALTGHHPVTSTTVASMNISSTIEMLKEVSLNSISEIGFTTMNNHEIKIGAMTKYYSDSFTSGNIKSVLAYCKSCKPVSDKDFLCEFHFFGADNKQVSQVRRNILQDKAHQTTELLNTHGRQTRILVLDEDAALGLEVKNFFTDKFKNAEVFQYSLLGQLLSDLSDKDTVHRQQLPETFDMVFANYEIFDIEKKKRWEQIQQYLTDRAAKHGVQLQNFPDLYLVSKRKLSFEVMKDLSEWVKEIYFTPLDKSYILKKTLCLNPHLLNKEATTLGSVKDSGALKVANPVQITQISEAGLVLKYYRAISIGAFREFILWRPEELDTPEIIGTVNFNEPNKSGEGYLNHFVFFGMKDYYLKHLRKWLLEAYIKTKDKE